MTKIAIEAEDGKIYRLEPSQFRLSYYPDGWKLTADGKEPVTVAIKSQIHILIDELTRDRMEKALDKFSKEGWRLVGPVQIREGGFEATMVK